MCPRASLFTDARWIGETDETNDVWRGEDARRALGITGTDGHDFVRAEGSRPLSKHCPRFRRTFPLPDKSIRSAVAAVSGLGFCELWANGCKADPTRVLSPGMTRGDIALYECLDVSPLLRPGADNTLGLWLAPGYSDDFSAYGWLWLAPMRAILKLEVVFRDGTCAKVVTDDSWETTPESPILSASIYHGEVYDAGRENAAWATPCGGGAGWRPAHVFPDGPELRLNAAPPVRLSDPLVPVSLVETGPGVWTADYGQNRAGVVSIRVKGAQGTRIRIRTSELLGKDGRIDPWTNYRALSTDEFVLAGGSAAEEYTPRFTYHGFRYTEISGLPAKPEPGDLVSWAVHSDVPPASSFCCSDETLTRLHDAARWSMLSNFMSYPTDCPMRAERTPCRMDSQAYEDAACQFFDMRGYYDKWLSDIAELDGGNPDMAADVATLPLRLWRHYGDREALARHYGPLKRYVAAQAEEHPGFLFDKGFGDWCAPNGGTWTGYFRSPSLVNTALFCHAAQCASEAAYALCLTDDASAFTRMADESAEAFNKRFLDPSRAVYGGGTQTEMVLPLAFGLVPKNLRAAVAANLARRIHDVDEGKVDTGIFGTRYLGDVLCDMGESDLLVEMFTQPEYPGFGYLFANGATTLWEQWAFRGDMHSHNHAMFSGAASWLYSHLAGIRPAKPGYAALLLKPCFPKRLAFVEATRRTPQGDVRIRWERTDGSIVLDIDVPSAVSTMLELPGRAPQPLLAGRQRISM